MVISIVIGHIIFHWQTSSKTQKKHTKSEHHTNKEAPSFQIVCNFFSSNSACGQLCFVYISIITLIKSKQETGENIHVLLTIPKEICLYLLIVNSTGEYQYSDNDFYNF